MMIDAVTSRSGLGRVMTTASPHAEVGGLAIQQLKPMIVRAAAAGWPSVQSIDPSALIQAMASAHVISDDDPSKLFAEVYKNGQVIARLYNGGSSTTYGQADGVITGADEPFGSGPKLAQWRADQIAAATGGTVKMAATAQTESAWQITNAAEQLRRDEVLAPYRAAMDAFRAAMDKLVPSGASQAAVTV